MKCFLSLALFVALLQLSESRRRKTTTSTTAQPTPSTSEEFDASPIARPRNEILIGAFNMKKFGLPKVTNESVMETIVKILKRYDVIAITEITDRTETAIKRLMDRLNWVSAHTYDYIMSDRVGRTNSKEQYAIIFRSDVIRVKKHFLFNDSAADPFEREPQIVHIQLKENDKDLVLVNIHVKPSAAVSEIDALTDVQTWIERRMKIKDVIMLGDFNADCSYVPKKSWKSIRLRTMEKFNWLIGDEVDTTVGKTNCAYDRIVLSGPTITTAVIPHSAQAFLFDTAFNLEEAQALQVSDHYPVEVAIRGVTGSRSREIRLFTQDQDILPIDTNRTGMSDTVYQPISNMSLRIVSVEGDGYTEGSGGEDNNSLIPDTDNKDYDQDYAKSTDKNATTTTTSATFSQKAKNRLAKLIPNWVKKLIVS